MHHSQNLVEHRSTVFVLLFLASAAAACAIALLSFGINLSGLIAFLCPLVFALPVSIVLFNFLNKRLKKKGSIGITLPLLVLPLLFGLLFAYMMFYERNPQHMFKMVVADPIPSGVTDIRARYLDDGFYQDILVSFRAPKGAVEMIIAQNSLERDTGKLHSPDRDLPEFSWGMNWVLYKKNLNHPDGNAAGYIDMWVDPDRSIVVFRRVTE